MPWPLYITPYQWVGEKEAYQVLSRVAAELSMLSIPFILFGDFNCVQERLEATGWFNRLKAQVVMPGGLEFTCAMGSRRIIDMWVVSSVLVPLVKRIGPADKLHVKPHIGLEMWISLKERDIRSVQQVTPPAFSLAQGPFRP